MNFAIYPAIDLRAGKVVRLQEGDPGRMTAYSDDPAETARRWLEAGARWLHVVNLDGAFGESDNMNRRPCEKSYELQRNLTHMCNSVAESVRLRLLRQRYLWE